MTTKLTYKEAYTRDPTIQTFLYDNEESKENENPPKFYAYGETLFTPEFPFEWAKTHKEDKTGPEFCKNCDEYGTWNAAFIGYCVDCANDIYNGNRGNGFVGYAEEMPTNKHNTEKSARQTYLKDITPVGDKTLFDTIKQTPHYELHTKGYQKLHKYPK